MNDETTPNDLAEQVINVLGPRATKVEWGEELHRLIAEHGTDSLAEFLHLRTVSSLGAYVQGVKAAREQRKQNERLMSLGVSTTTSRPISPVISVRRPDGSSQGVLWTEAAPLAFVDAVLREQRVVDGRNNSNAQRLAIVRLIESREDLASLPTLADVCRAVGVDPDALDLGDLSG